MNLHEHFKTGAGRRFGLTRVGNGISASDLHDRRARGLAAFPGRVFYGSLAVAAAIGALVLAGWIFDIPIFKNVHSGWVSMKVNTALALLLTAAGLWCVRPERAARWRRRLGQAIGLAVSLIGLLTLSEYLWGWNLGLDQFLIRERAGGVGTIYPGRMAPLVALSFSLIGATLVLLGAGRRGAAAAQALALGVALLVHLGLTGYALNAHSLYHWFESTVAVHTLLGLGALVLAILCARPRTRLMATLLSPEAGGMLARRLLPATLILPLLVGIARLRGEHEGLYDTPVGVAIMVLSISFAMVGLIIWTACIINHAVAERAVAEKLMRQSEKDFREAFAHAPIGMVINDLHGRYLYVNEAYTRITGYQEEELLGSAFDFFIITAPEDRQHNADEYRRLLAGEIPAFFIEKKYIRKDGDLVWVRVSASLRRDEDGRPVQIVGLVEDISERKRAENRLHGFYDSDMLGVFYWRRDGSITGANDKFLEMVGYSRDDLDSGRIDWEHMTPPEYRARDEEVLEELRTGRIDVPYEKEYIRKDGRRIPILVGAAMLNDGSQEGMAYILDITERKRAEEALRVANERLTEADRRKDEFLAMLAHELRNPLAPIRYAVQMMQLAGSGSAIERRQRDVIDRQVSHMSRLLEDLLDVSRITRGKIQLRKERLDLRQVVAQAAESMRSQIETHGLTLALQATSAPLMVEGDPTRLEQVVRNLLHNAVKYTEPGGCVYLTVGLESDREQDWRAVVRVHDSGIGIAPEMAERIFDLFAQAEHTLDRSQGGLGIGLTMVRRLVEMHHGAVEVHSAGLGRGSEFVVRLPLVDAAIFEIGEVSPAVPDCGAAPSERSHRVLVVEDNEDAAASLSELLGLWGHEVQAVHNGQQALSAARQFRPDLVLLDIGLPGMDGYTVARHLRHETATAGACVVAVTGYGGEEDRRRAREAGFDHHLTKPVELGQLERILNNLRAA